MKRTFLIILVTTFTVFVLNAQDPPKPIEIKAPVLNGYEADESSPHGRLNPKAPAETGQFEFMIGVFDCDDQLQNPADGKWYLSKSVWTSSYFLNGFGVQDKYWSPIMVTSSTRIFNAEKGKWIVTYFQSQPRSSGGVWEGMKEGANMVMRRQTGAVESRLTVSNITKDGFDWIGERVEGENVTSGWNISCKRRK